MKNKKTRKQDAAFFSRTARKVKLANKLLPRGGRCL